MHPSLVVQFESLWIAPFDVVDVQIKDERETWPQDVNRDLFKHTVQDIHSIYPRHLFFALLVDLSHDKTAVNVKKIGIAVLLQLVDEVLADYLLENLVKHEGLLGLVAQLEVKELKNEEELLGDRVRDQLHLAAEDLFDQMTLALLL